MGKLWYLFFIGGASTDDLEPPSQWFPKYCRLGRWAKMELLKLAYFWVFQRRYCRSDDCTLFFSKTLFIGFLSQKRFARTTRTFAKFDGSRWSNFSYKKEQKVRAQMPDQAWMVSERAKQKRKTREGIKRSVDEWLGKQFCRFSKRLSHSSVL